MPAIWSSSERPLSVRTIWVDGIRHPILTSDDPLLAKSKKSNRPRTSKEPRYSMKYESEPRTDCLTKVIRQQSAPLYHRIFFNCSKIVGSNETIENNSEKSLKNSVIKIVENVIGDTNKKERFQFNSNSLSERVLQWLDLSGKVNDYSVDEEIDQLSQFEDPNEHKIEIQDSFEIDGSITSESTTTNEHFQVESDKFSWYPNTRLQLHIFMPSVGDNESLIDD